MKFSSKTPMPAHANICGRCAGDGSYESDVSLPHDVQCGRCSGRGWVHTEMSRPGNAPSRRAYGLAIRPRVYVAASRTELARVRAVAAALEEAGFALACPWWEIEGGTDPNADAALTDDQADELATRMQLAVLGAAVFIYLAPPPGVGRGCHVELGMAIAGGIPVVMAGEHARAVCFWALTDLITKTDEGAVARAVEICADELTTAHAVEQGAA